MLYSRMVLCRFVLVRLVTDQSWFTQVIWTQCGMALSFCSVIAGVTPGNSRIIQKKKNRETGRKKKPIRQHMMPTSSYTNCTQVELCWKGCTEIIDVCLFYWKFEEGQFEDYTEEEEQRDWKKEETNKATYDANILLHQLHTGRIVLERVHINH